MTISDDDIRSYFQEYGDSLARFDARASAELWGEPGMVLTDEFVGVAASRDEMVHGLTQGYPLYQRLGLAGVSVAELETTMITERIVSVRVRWLFHDSAGEELTDGTFVYLVRRDDDGRLRAYVSVGVDEQEKIAALAAEKGIDLT